MAGWRSSAALCLVAAAVVGILAGCNLYSPPFTFNNVYDPNRDTTSTIALRTIAVDGNSGDWGDTLPMMIDSQGDWDNLYGSGQAIDISAVYLAKDSTYLYWRIDLWDGPASSAANYGLNIWQGIENSTESITVSHGAGGVYAALEHTDGTGLWLGDPIPDALAAIGSSFEGRVPLASFGNFVSPRAHFYATYSDVALGQDSYDDGGVIELSL
ncbi:MAG TPA: hypothetical protein VMW69_01470 [Spirochaetia bacterium]|nr:hypothetical protein [Spirochaetia bacterium]